MNTCSVYMTENKLQMTPLNESYYENMLTFLICTSYISLVIGDLANCVYYMYHNVLYTDI